MTPRIHFFITVNFLLAAASCYAMNQLDKKTNNPLRILKITGIHGPRQVEFITNHLAIINDQNGCALFDITLNKKINQLSDKNDSYISVHQNKKKIALSHDRTVTIHDIATGAQEWSTSTNLQGPKILSCMFIPSDDTILLRYCWTKNITVHNYINNTTSTLFHDNDHRSFPPKIACHPTKKELCVAYIPGAISIHHPDTFAELKKIQNGYEDCHFYCEYSPDGSSIVCTDSNNVYIINANSYTCQCLAKSRMARSATFHPNNSALAILTQRDHLTVNYWNPQTLELIDTTSSLLLNDDDPICRIQGLSFSPDGTKLLVASPNKCIVLPVPFKVMYQPNPEKRLSYLVFLLKNYSPDQCTPLPRDIIQLFIQTLLKI